MGGVLLKKGSEERSFTRVRAESCAVQSLQNGLEKKLRTEAPKFADNTNVINVNIVILVLL